jgi:hypothetical protein
MGVSPRRKSSSTPRWAKPLNLSTVATRDVTKSSSSLTLRAPSPGLIEEEVPTVVHGMRWAAVWTAGTLAFAGVLSIEELTSCQS